MQKTNKTHRVFAMTVAQFVEKHELSPQVRNDLVREALGYEGAGGLSHKKLLERARIVYMQDALQALTHTLTRNNSDLGEKSPHLAKALLAEGLTYLDVPCLPLHTATLTELRRLGKETLRQTNVRVLGTLSGIAIRTILYDVCRSYDDRVVLTVNNMLEISPWTGERAYACRTIHQSLLKTRAYLCKLGFTYEDGPFMQDGTRRQFVEKLMSEDDLSKRAATKVADLAMKYRWVSKFIG